MALALSLGRRGMGRVWPNPAVGCVIVRDGQIVGRGWTADGGRPHAETRALLQAGARANGATAYVTLEPCSHHGKTPPCAQALIDAKIARVVIGAGDPDDRVAGRGARMLQDAGIQAATAAANAASTTFAAARACESVAALRKPERRAANPPPSPPPHPSRPRITSVDAGGIIDRRTRRSAPTSHSANSVDGTDADATSATAARAWELRASRAAACAARGAS